MAFDKDFNPVLRFTVVSDIPCKLGYLSEDGYVAVAPVMNPDGSYSYVLPEGIEVAIVVVATRKSTKTSVSTDDNNVVSINVTTEEKSVDSLSNTFFG